MKYYLITFHNQPSVVVEAPDSTSAMGLCCGRISTYEEISGSCRKILVDAFGLKFVKWPFYF
jgi:hypothetical protein